MNKTSELIRLVTQFNPLSALEPVWIDLASSEPLFPKLSVSEKAQILPLLQKHCTIVKNPRHKTILEHLIALASAPPPNPIDDIEYGDIFNQKRVKEQLNAIKAIQARRDQEQSRLAGELSYEDSKLQQLPKGTDMYINSLLKQLNLVKQQLQLESNNDLHTHVNHLEKDLDKQDQDIQLLHQKKLKYDERLRMVEQEYQKTTSQNANTPHEARLQHRIAALEQNLFETTELLKKSNVASQEVNSIIGVEQISVAQLKIIIDNLGQELKKSETVSEDWKKQYQEVQQKLANLHLHKLDQTQVANRALQDTVNLSKREAEEVRALYNARVTAFNTLHDNFVKLQSDLESIHAAQESTLIQLRQELESAKSESTYHKERFEKMQSNEAERNNHMRVTLEAEFRTKHESDQTKYLHEMERLRQESHKNAEAIRIHRQSLTLKEMEIKTAKDTMNDQRRLDSQSIGKLTEQIRKLEQDITQARRDLQTQADSIKTKDARLEAVAAQSKYNDAIVKSITDRANLKVTTYEKQASDASAQSHRMMLERDQASSQIVQLRTQMEHLRSNILISTKTGLSCDQQIAQLEKKSANELVFANSKLATVQTEFNALRKKLAESESVHKHSDRIKEELTTEREKVAKYITEMKELKNTISTLQVTNSQSLSEKTSIQSLLKQCSATQKEAYHEQNKLDQRIQDMAKLHTEEKQNINMIMLKQTQAIAQQESSIKELQATLAALTIKLRESDDGRATDKAACRDTMKKHVQAKDAAVRALIEMQRQ